MPFKSTHLIILHSKSTHYKIIPLFSTHLQKRLLSESLFGVKCFSDLMTQDRNHTCTPLFTTQSLHHSHHTHKLEITLAHLSSPPTHHITLNLAASRFRTPTKYHTWQFLPQLLHQQYRAIQEGHQRYNAN